MKKNKTHIRSILCTILLLFLSLQLTACNRSSRNPDISATGSVRKDETQKDSQEGKSQDEPSAISSDLVAEPLFSSNGGFYNKAFLLTLSAQTDNKIYYTTDGSDPRTSATAMLYSKEISVYNNTDEPNILSAVTDISLAGYQPPRENVDKGIVIRAVSKAEDGTYSKVVSNSYFVEKSASYYTDMKVISMVTDSDYLFDPDTGAYMVGSKYYEWRDSDEYVSYDPGDVSNVTNYNTGGRESEFPVSIQVFEGGKAVYSADVGARISGNWSRAHAQKSFRLYARKEYGDSKMKYAFFEDLTDNQGELIEKFDKVTLRNGGNDYQTLHFRDALFQDLVKDLSCDTMASEPCILFLDGEFWGFYFIREKTDGDYIESHYGIDKNEVAVIKIGEIDTGTEEDLNEFRDLCDWAMSADMTVEKNYASFCERFDIQNFMDYMTVQTYICNNDFANGGMNNWQVWHSKTINPDLPKADGKWRFILYDLDFAAGLYNSTGTSYSYDSLNQIYSGDEYFNLPAILRNVCKNETFRQTFYDNYIRIADTCFASDIVEEKIDEYTDAYAEATKDTFFRFGIDWAAFGYEGNAEQLKNFFRLRPRFAKQYLNTFCGIETQEEQITENMLPDTTQWTYYGPATFYANPADNSFSVNVPNSTVQIWDIQSQACDLTLEKGSLYRLSFDASCSVTSSFDVGFNRYDGFGYPSCWWNNITLSPELTNYEFYIDINEETFPDWRLCFNFGHGKGDFVIKNATLTRVDS